MSSSSSTGHPVPGSELESVEVPFEYRVTSVPPPTWIDSHPDDQVEIRYQGTYSGPAPDHPDFSKFVSLRWREVVASWGGDSHMILTRTTTRSAAPAPRIVGACRAAEDFRPETINGEEDSEVMFACLQDEGLYITILYWGHPAEEPEIQVYQLPGVSEVGVTEGLVFQGIPEEQKTDPEVLERLAQGANVDFVVRHYAHGEAPASERS